MLVMKCRNCKCERFIYTCISVIRNNIYFWSFTFIYCMEKFYSTKVIDPI